MQIYRHFNKQSLAPLALAIGNFDGVHMGHQAILTNLMVYAKAQHQEPAVMTFEPHPREFFSPDNAPARLTTLREKLELFEVAGVEKVYICRFDTNFANMTATGFIQHLHQMKVKSILVGEDFRFGAKRAGGLVDFKTAGFTVLHQPQVISGGTRVSSTRVREALVKGDLMLASQLLSRPYSMSGNVVHGAKRGRQLGFPTANVHMRHERSVLTGVYAVKFIYLISGATQQVLLGVANLGVRPTIKGVPKLSLEVHLLDFNGDLYGQHVHVEFLHKIRDEKKFDGLEALKAQIGRDVNAAKQYFSKTIF